MRQSIVVSASTSDSDMLTALSAVSGDFEVVWRMRAEDTFNSTGMVVVESGIVAPSDITRVLEVAMSVQVNSDVALVPTSSVCQYLVDGDVQTEYMPLGLPGKRLEVKLSIGSIPRGALERFKILAAAVGRKMIGWRVDVA